MKKQIMIGSRIAFFLWISAAALAGPIHDAVRAGDLAKVKALVAANPKIVNEKDARGRTPLHFASGAGNVEIVKFLIAGGADVKAADPDGFTPLHWAASAGFLSLVDYILSHGGSAEGKSDTGGTLLYAAAAGDKDVKGNGDFYR